MAEWQLKAEDIYAGVMVVDFGLTVFRVAVTADFEAYTPILERAQLDRIRRLNRSEPG
jgi:hypothetical protein